MEEFYKWIIPEIKGKKLLDVGCGDGFYLKHGSPDSLGIDISDKVILRSKAKMSFNMVKMSSMELKYKEKFDVCICSHVLEHIEHRKDLCKTVKNIYASLKPGGKLIVVGPYAYGPNAWLQWEHERAFTLTYLCGLLEEYNFKILKAFLFFQFPFQNIFSQIFGRIVCPIKHDYFLKVL